MSERRPLIGIPCRNDPSARTFYLQRDYSEAIWEAGGAPLMIPLLTAAEYVEQIAGLVEGILLPGSDSDVDPSRYGQKPHPQIGRVDRERDTVDWFLLDHAFKRELPVLGICFGLQSLNVFLGGSLIQDIPSQVRTDVRHERGKTGPGPRHTVRWVSQNLLSDLAGGRQVEVNSSHHQSIERMAPALELLAEAPDGIVEAARLSSDRHFVLGVQWHPERGFREDGLSRRVFETFVEKVRGRLSAHADKYSYPIG